MKNEIPPVSFKAIFKRSEMLPATPLWIWAASLITQRCGGKVLDLIGDHLYRPSDVYILGEDRLDQIHAMNEASRPVIIAANHLPGDFLQVPKDSLVIDRMLRRHGISCMILGRTIPPAWIKPKGDHSQGQHTEGVEKYRGLHKWSDLADTLGYNLARDIGVSILPFARKEAQRRNSRMLRRLLLPNLRSNNLLVFPQGRMIATADQYFDAKTLLPGGKFGTYGTNEHEYEAQKNALFPGAFVLSQATHDHPEGLPILPIYITNHGEQFVIKPGFLIEPGVKRGKKNALHIAMAWGQQMEALQQEVEREAFDRIGNNPNNPAHHSIRGYERFVRS